MLPRYRLLFECGRTVRIGLPIVIAQLLNISMGFVDTVMTGNYSAEALAAVSSSQHMVIPLVMFSAAVISAGQAITAQYTEAGWTSTLAAWSGSIPMISNLLSYWAVGMSLGVVLGFLFELQARGMWNNIITGLSVAAILHGLRFRQISGHWIRRPDNRDTPS